MLITLMLATELLVGHNGPVHVILGPPDRIEAVCSALTQHVARGCVVTFSDGSFTIWCPSLDADCIAHEIRHVIEPGWVHEDAPQLPRRE